MKLVHTAGSALVILLVAVSTTARAGTSRAEVLDALAEARRTGELMAPGDSGLTLREMNPERYPAAAAGPARTRADVVAEVREALRDGDLAIGDSGLTGRELNPGAYPARPAAAGRS